MMTEEGDEQALTQDDNMKKMKQEVRKECILPTHTSSHLLCHLLSFFLSWTLSSS